MRVPDTLAYLRGHWRITRSLTDHLEGTSGSLTGTASFLPLPDEAGGLAYREDGQISLAGYRGPASRSLLWLPAGGGAADVRFADGRAFYLADLRPGWWRAEHRCGADVYHVSYHLHGPGLLTERWRARGPRKDYLMMTYLVRALPVPAPGS